MQKETQQLNQQPTKRDLRLQKREQEQGELLRQIRRKKIKKTALFVVPALIIAGAIALWAVKSSGSSPNQSGDPKLKIGQKEYDFGTVSMAAGIIRKTFEIKNTGTADLEIENLRTSCHCTTAILTANGKKGPTFGMDGSAFWSQKIPPGQTAELESIFDPAFHGPAGVGAATREIYFTTNDPDNKQAEVTLNVNVIP